MANSVKKERKQLVIDIIIVLIAVIVATVVFMLTFSKETTTIPEYERDGVTSVVCNNSTNEGSFFKNDISKSISNEIKVVLSNNKLKNISFTHKGTLSSESEAEHMIGVLHADLNEYLYEYNKTSSDYSPRFTTTNNTITIELLTGVENIDSVTAKFFYIDSSNFHSIKSYPASQIKSYYEKKGFSCNIQE